MQLTRSTSTVLFTTLAPLLINGAFDQRAAFHKYRKEAFNLVGETSESLAQSAEMGAL
jgi:hypothetical protein